ncbi:glycosyl hydrolase family 25 [Prevotella copri]|nr:glycosyl hydrolase family 25 [Segatella copri]MQM46258.1 glycosyl hydrolase family 25 [Segatella copri]MQM48858.1 glycosyl hydrolase family 25 [Segatella copri]MQM58730.1 glycosyl hydrolase family 25 [Segatella copri]MQM66842.1 glycosyl hydrolase family 25 [Segatella copri]
MNGETAQGSRIFQLSSETTPEGVKAISPQLAASLATAHGVTLRRSIDYTLLPDSLGYYRGTTDSIYQPNGHGCWQGYDGTYYEGYWKNGKREGFGFSIAPKKPLRIGEWKNDRYKGERLVYTSERIYGIDLSKYQHGKGRKKYAINWNRLRITHLGRLSKKTISGTVNFPIRFIYIKSTEGKSLLNPYYRKDYRDAKAHGYKVGTYHFFTTITPAAEQARHFLKHSIIRKGDFPPVLDVEPLPSQIKKMGGAGVLFARIRTWLRIVERATGVKPILYISQTFVNRYLPQAPDLKHNYQVWIARYGEYKPDIRLVYWQLCPDGRVAGIHGEVDINVFNGYDDAFQSFVKNKTVK